MYSKIHHLNNVLYECLFSGVSWVFGFLAIGPATVVFQYLFCILTTPQGVLIFVMFTLRNRQLRESWSIRGRSLKYKTDADPLANRGQKCQAQETSMNGQTEVSGSVNKGMTGIHEE